MLYKHLVSVTQWQYNHPVSLALRSSSPWLKLRHVSARLCSATATSAKSSTETATQNPKKAGFKTLDGSVDNTSTEFSKNVAVYQGYVDQYKKILGLATSGGGPKAIERHTKANKKLMAWDRANLLFDDYSSVLEIGTLTGMQMEYGNVPRAGVITAIGKIKGVYCVVNLNDGSVKGGTMYPISVKKNLRAQEIAIQNRIPHVYVVDSGGAFLPLQADIFPDKEDGGRVFYNEAIMNSMNIPQLAIVVGSCTAGGAYLPTMVQESIIVDKIGTIFLGGPPLVKAALGEVVSAEVLGGATLHCSTSGYTDHFAETENEAFDMGRDIVETFNIQPCSYPESWEEPIYSIEDLTGIIPAREQHTMDAYKVLARLTDGSRFHEFKTRYGKGLVTGFGRLKGHLVGFVINNGPTTEESALKGSHFVQLCDQRDVPLIFLQNTWPEDLSAESEERAIENGKRMRAEAKMMGAIACARVPKLTAIIGNSQGISNYAMCGRSFSPNFLFCWPNAQVSIQPPKELAKILTKDIQDSETTSEITKTIHLKSSAIFSASRMTSDGVILPEDTRKILGQCLEIVKQRTPSQTDKIFSVLRM